MDCSSTCVDPVLLNLEILAGKMEDLESVEINSGSDQLSYCKLVKINIQLQFLKVEFRLLRTLFLCARKLWSNSDPAGNGTDHHGGQGSFLCSLQDFVEKYALDLPSFCDRLERGGLSSVTDLEEFIFIFQDSIICFKQEIEQFYITLSDSLCKSGSTSLKDHELMDIIDSLLQNLVDLLSPEDCDGDVEELILALQEKIKFLKNFISFAIFRGAEERQLEIFVSHSQVVAVNAARLCCMCWFGKDDVEVCNEVKFKIPELLHSITPIDPQVHQTYVQVLRAPKLPGSTHTLNLEKISNIIAARLCCMCWFGKDDVEVCNEVKFKIPELLYSITPIDPQVHQTCAQVLRAPKLPGSSHTLNLEKISNILGDFVDSLLSQLWELLHCGTRFMVSVKMLYEGLRFLRIILKNQQVKFDELHEQMMDFVGVAVSESGIIICSLFANVFKGIDLNILDFLEKIKLVEAQFGNMYPLTLTFGFPSNSELDFIDILQENLKQLAICGVRSISFAKDRVEELEEDLIFLRSCLQNIEKHYNQHEKLQYHWSRIIEATIRAEFVIHSLRGGDLSDSCCMLFNTIAEEIKLIKTEVLEHDDQEQGFESQKVAKISSHVPSQSGISKANEVTVDLVDQVEIVTNLLIRGSKKFEIVSIVGMPGLGKTNLAKRVYNNPSVRCHFHAFGWSTVSQVYNRKSMLFEILVCVAPMLSEQYETMNEDDLVEVLYKCLKRKRYLIILDDVWDGEVWVRLEKSFPDDVNGSRILLTSRNHKVGLQVGSACEPHSLRRLNDEESWKLLRKKVFGNEECPPALYELGVQIAKNCNGLPLIVVVIAGILATREPDGWQEVAQRLSSYTVIGTEECRDILELSYRNLPDYLQRCLLYFGAFREDQEIPIWRLKWLWIAEGFVQETELKCLEDVAEEYMMDLIDRSLVMVAKRSSIGNVKTCHIHDLLHEFCVAKAEEENFLKLLHGCGDDCFRFNVSSNIHRLSIHCKQEQFQKSRLFCPRLRCLLYFADGDRFLRNWCNISFIFHIFKLLRVLDLGKFNLGDRFPSEVERLVELRFLAIKGTMRSIPSSIANLSNLETFLLDSDETSLPDTMLNMKKLTNLCITGRFTYFTFERFNLGSCSVFHNLHTLSTAYIRYEQGIEKIMRKFPYIRELKCKLSYGESAKYIVALNFLTRLESLKLLHDQAWIYKIQYHFPGNLKKLSLHEVPLSTMSTIGKLPSLEVLSLSSGNLEWRVWEMKAGEFPKLRTLKMKYLYIKRWIGSDDNFPYLEKLILLRCGRMEEIPYCLWNISTLNIIEVHNCSRSLASLAREIEEEQKSMGNEDLKVRIT